MKSKRPSTTASTPEAKQRAPRMRDVADRAGVGMMTVSRVLNRTAHVTEETSARVYRALKELQYQPNFMARALRGHRSRSIGVILPYLYDPFFATCAHAISAVAKQHAYSVLLATSDERADTETEAARDLLRRHVDGIIVIPACNGRSRLTDAEFHSTPMVAIDRPIPRSPTDTVLVENQHGATLATEHLIQHGHKRICFIGLSQKIYTIHARLAGYMKAMQAASLKPECFFNAADEAATLNFLRSTLGRPNPPTAIFAANGLASRDILHAVAALDIHVPEEIAFIGFDDFALADILRPSLTVVRQPVERAGEQAAQLLFSRLDGACARPTQKLSLPVELIIRRSCGCHPI
jgi:LacI family transcriptional regulator